MSCYLPLVHRWRRQDSASSVCSERSGRRERSGDWSSKTTSREQTDCSHVLALRDGKGVTLSQGYGDFPHQVFVAIRHDHPTLGLGDVAYQRLHQDHTHRSRREEGQETGPGVVSLGLPLGISSLKLTHRHRRKQKTHNKGPSDSQAGQMKSDLYQMLSKSSHSLTEASPLQHAPRKSSLPRKAKIPSRYQPQPRPSSVDADLLMQSKDKSLATPPPGAQTRAKFCLPRDDTPEETLKFAHLTSPTSFMASHEGDKSSSGNSSASELTSEEYIHPAIRGRGRVNMTNILQRGPPPRHLLPAKLKPSPPIKLHPYVALPPRVVKDVVSSPLCSTPDSSRTSPHRSRAGSPFGKSRQGTPRTSVRRREEKSATPSPLDLGYQTLEHSYDGESSLSSEDPAPGGGLSLLSLPDLLLTRILSHLPSLHLARVSTTSRRLRRLSWQPELWTTIALSEERLDVDKAIRSILGRLVWGGGREEPLRGASSVETVRLGGSTRLTDRTLALLARNCPQLHRLELQRCRNVTNGGLLDLMTRCSKINHLDLTGCPMVSSINIVRKQTQLSLVHLDMSECSSLDDTGLHMIVLNCQLMTHLYLRKCSNITDTGVKTIALYCPQIRELSVSECGNVTDYGLCELAKLGPSLRYLSVSKCPRISDTGLRHLVSHCYKLRYLNTRGCQAVTDATILSLTNNCTRLKSLDVGKCDVTDNGLRQLAKMLPGLRKLSVRGCPLVGDPGILAVARSCRYMVQLNMMDCEVSLQAVNIASRELRNCYIESSFLHSD